jgi:uncharacterized protein YgiM (DUF1202 family)
MFSYSQLVTLLIGLAALATACIGVYEKLIVVRQEMIKNKTVTRLGYVLDPDGWANLRSYPNISAEILARVKNNTRVEIHERSADWLRVKTEAGAKGYIHSSRVVAELSN